MTHDELLTKIMRTEFYKEKQPNNVTISVGAYNNENANAKALRAVVELHKNYRLDGIYYECSTCGKSTTHCPTIKAIEKELQ